MKKGGIKPSMMVKSITSHVIWAEIWAIRRRAQVGKAEGAQVWTVRVIMELVPLKSGSWSMMAGTWDWIRKRNVDSIAMGSGIVVPVKSKR